MRLSSLLEGLADAEVAGRPRDAHIGSLHYRSADVAAGGLFVAIAGSKADGHDFIDQALDRGAAALLTMRPVAAPVPVVVSANPRRLMAALAARFYGHPSGKLCLVAITGTNGKTTVAYLVEALLATAGLNVGVIGTVNCRFAGRVRPSPVTTPESPDLQATLAQMAAAGVTHVVMEVSSHGIDQHRIDGCQLDVAVFTNLTRDHLDYHGTMEAYWACKKRLFSEHLFQGPKKDRARAVVNAFNPYGRQLSQIQPVQTLTLGADPACTLRAEAVDLSVQGIACRVHGPGGSFVLNSPLVGRHNLENLLCAVGVGQALAVPSATVSRALASCKGAPGRLERVVDPAGRQVFVDYAHSPDALERVLGALRSLGDKRLVCVFGCGGDRDTGKRPLMGEIAARLCDVVVVTSDNPRSEPPMDIIAGILPGIQRVMGAQADRSGSPTVDNRGYLVEPDRRQAIRRAIAAARPGDTVLIAGKGHEAYQLIGGQTIAFDDREQAAWALAQVREGR